MTATSVVAGQAFQHGADRRHRPRPAQHQLLAGGRVAREGAIGPSDATRVPGRSRAIAPRVVAQILDGDTQVGRQWYGEIE